MMSSEQEIADQYIGEHFGLQCAFVRVDGRIQLYCGNRVAVCELIERGHDSTIAWLPDLKPHYQSHAIKTPWLAIPASPWHGGITPDVLSRYPVSVFEIRSARMTTAPATSVDRYIFMGPSAFHVTNDMNPATMQVLSGVSRVVVRTVPYSIAHLTKSWALPMPVPGIHAILVDPLHAKTTLCLITHDSAWFVAGTRHRTVMPGSPFRLSELLMIPQHLNHDGNLKVPLQWDTAFIANNVLVVCKGKWVWAWDLASLRNQHTDLITTLWQRVIAHTQSPDEVQHPLHSVNFTSGLFENVFSQLRGPKWSRIHAACSTFQCAGGANVQDSLCDCTSSGHREWASQQATREAHWAPIVKAQLKRSIEEGAWRFVLLWVVVGCICAGFIVCIWQHDYHAKLVRKLHSRWHTDFAVQTERRSVN